MAEKRPGGSPGEGSVKRVRLEEEEFDRGRGRGRGNGQSPEASSSGQEERPRGRASGRGRGRGGRMTYEQRRQERLDQHDLVKSRPSHVQNSKRGKSGRPVNLLANYFVLDKRTDWALYQYRVDFDPDEDDTRLKKRLFRQHQQTIGAYIFDGSTLYISHRLNENPTVLTSRRENDETKVEISIRLVSQLEKTDVMYLQVYSILVRKCLESMNLEELGRHYYDRHQAIKIQAHGLELWPGYVTSMRNYEENIMLCVELTHKVLRTDNCLQVMNRLRGHHNYREAVEKELVGTIVMSSYNRKTYRVDDIDWNSNPTKSFEVKGKGEITFKEYFKVKHDKEIYDLNQPLLISRPKKRDLHRGQTGPVLLVPELCQMTGLTDEMRANFQLMKSLTGFLHVGPDRRLDSVRNFMRRLQGAPNIREELSQWGLEFQRDVIKLQGRTFDKENIMFRGGARNLPNDKFDWSQSFRDTPMASSVELKEWVLLVPSRDAHSIEELVNKMQRVAQPMKMTFQRPREIIRLSDQRIPTYVDAIDRAMANYRKLQLVYVVLPRPVTDIYAAIKKKCTLDYGVASQCFVAKNACNPRGILSVASKVVIQINAKLGGEPWYVQIPLKKLMIVGFDVYHCGKRRGMSVGAMVATTHESQARYYSTVSFHNCKEELSCNLCSDMSKCLYAYQNRNGFLPERIIMYRDGVGDGQLGYVYETELAQIKATLDTVYGKAEKPLPKFSFIVVSKKIHTRLFAKHHNTIENPEAGTVVDDVITLPERYDFYLVSQYSRQGTVSPVSYNVLHDTQGLDPDKIQRLTYKLCHLYFNWSGTVTVPAPCQYAHKLAYLTGVALQGNGSNERLSHTLHYL